MGTAQFMEAAEEGISGTVIPFTLVPWMIRLQAYPGELDMAMAPANLAAVLATTRGPAVMAVNTLGAAASLKGRHGRLPEI